MARGAKDTCTSRSATRAQNVYLQALALALGTTEVGAFDDHAVKSVLGLATDQDPLAIMPIGRIR
jgi:nitroreductase